MVAAQAGRSRYFGLPPRRAAAATYSFLSFFKTNVALIPPVYMDLDKNAALSPTSNKCKRRELPKE